jgi:hypothetical protein
MFTVNIRRVTAITGVRDVSHRANSCRAIFLFLQETSFCREAEMNENKKKYWREKVTAEITLAHLQQFAREAGTNMNTAEVAAFLNEKGRAQAVWTHMMQAGEDYIKSTLPARNLGLHNLERGAAPLRSLR